MRVETDCSCGRDFASFSKTLSDTYSPSAWSSSARCFRITSSIATPPKKPKPAIAGNQVLQPYFFSNQPIRGKANPEPK